jgi:hypothetical protein
MKLCDLLEDADRLVAHLKTLPFQEGKPIRDRSPGYRKEATREKKEV